MAFSYYKVITVDKDKVTGGPHSNYLLYLDITDTDLAAMRADAYDLSFYADVNQITQYPHTTHEWTDGTGHWIGRVCVTDGVDSAADKEIYMFYGDAAQSSDLGSETDTFSPMSAEFVLLFEDDPATNTVTDHSGNSPSRDLTATGGTFNRHTDGIVGTYAWGTSAGSARLYTSEDGAPGTAGHWTHVWIEPASLADEGIWSFGASVSQVSYVYFNSTQVGTRWYEGSTSSPKTRAMAASPAFTTGSYQCMDYVLDRSNNELRAYKNGSLNASFSDSWYSGKDLQPTASGAETWFIDRDGGGSFTGKMSGCIVASTTPTANYIATIYENENSVSTFYTVGAQQTVGGGGGGNNAARLINGGLINTWS